MTSLLTETEKGRITNRIREILAAADMNSITIKGIRQQVESEDGKNYSGEKEFFSEIIQKIIAEPQQTQQDADEEEEVTVQQSVDDDYELALHLQQQEENVGKKSLRRRQASVLKKYTDGNIHIAKKTKTDGEETGKKSRGAPNNRLNKPMLLSEELQNLLGNQWTELGRPETVKQIWVYIKEHNLQDPADKRIIVGDEKFVAVFKKPKISCFAMNKVLSSHLFRKDDSFVSITESEISNSERSSKKRKTTPINRRLLMIPGVTEDMPLEVMQATILNYTKSTKLRHPEDPDLIRIVQGSPIFDMLGCPSDEETINVAHLITKINDMYHGSN